MKKDKSADKPHRVRTAMPVEQRKTASTNSVTNNIPVPMRKAISRNCTLPPSMSMSANTCRLCWKVCPKARLSITLHRKFCYARAAYFGLSKVSAQSHLKAMCLNLLKAANLPDIRTRPWTKTFKAAAWSSISWAIPTKSGATVIGTGA